MIIRGSGRVSAWRRSWQSMELVPSRPLDFRFQRRRQAFIRGGEVGEPGVADFGRVFFAEHGAEGRLSHVGLVDRQIASPSPSTPVARPAAFLFETIMTSEW